MSASAHQRILRLAALRSVHNAFQWMHLQEPRLRQWQIEMIRIPSPPFGEAARAAWMLERMQEMELPCASLDGAGNAVSMLREPVEGEPLVLLSAHIDTVFPEDTPLNVMENGNTLHAPGACDNAAGATALLAIMAAMQAAEVRTGANVLFAANVGEEAEGNLRGMRHLFGDSNRARRIHAAIALEGSGTEAVVTRALGSKRFQVSVSGPGGHAWTDAGRPNPIVVLARAIAVMDSFVLPETPRTTVNVGAMRGGSSVTAIPESASALFDLRSVDADELLRCEVALFRAVEDAVMEANQNHEGAERLRFNVRSIGDRPAATLAEDSGLLQTIRAVDRHLGIRTGERIGSTDANLPLSLGYEAVAMGAGGRSGGIHTTQEWYDPTGRELALRRILLTLLDCCERAGESKVQ